MSMRLPAETSVLASRRQMSMNRNFSRAEKYSLSRRKPENERAGHGKSASSGAKPTACSVSGGRITGWASVMIVGQGDRDRYGPAAAPAAREPCSPPRKTRSRSRPSWVKVMVGLAQRKLMRRQATAPRRPDLAAPAAACPKAGRRRSPPATASRDRRCGTGTSRRRPVRLRSARPDGRRAGPGIPGSAANRVIATEGMGAR